MQADMVSFLFLFSVKHETIRCVTYYLCRCSKIHAFAVQFPIAVARGFRAFAAALFLGKDRGLYGGLGRGGLFGNLRFLLIFDRGVLLLLCHDLNIHRRKTKARVFPWK